MARLLRVPALVAGLMAVPLLAIPGQSRDSNGPPDARPRRAARSAVATPPLVGTITGTVTVAHTNEPLDAVTVQIEGTQLGANTNASGTYRIVNVPAGTHTLIARRLGYARATQQVAVSDNGTATANFSLERTSTTLDQVIVTGTPEAQTKRELGNAIGLVNAAEVAKLAPPPNVQQLLNGVSGVRVQSAGGDVGSGGNTRIRGASSMTLASEPRSVLARCVAEACAARPVAGFERECAWGATLGAKYPGDVGVVGALLLNHVTLAPGEGLFLPAGRLHAYLGGLGVEVMASSDNVLRGGLTPKFIDVPELLRTVEFKPVSVPMLTPEISGLGQELYQPPFREFQLQRIELAPGGAPVPLAQAGAAVVIVGDLNADGYPDVFVGSSMNFPFRYGVNTVFLNDRGEKFRDAEFILDCVNVAIRGAHIDVDALGDLLRRDAVWSVLIQQRPHACESCRAISLVELRLCVGHVEP